MSGIFLTEEKTWYLYSDRDFYRDPPDEEFEGKEYVRIKLQSLEEFGTVAHVLGVAFSQGEPDAEDPVIIRKADGERQELDAYLSEKPSLDLG